MKNHSPAGPQLYYNYISNHDSPFWSYCLTVSTAEGLICTPLITETYKRFMPNLSFPGTNNHMTVLTDIHLLGMKKVGHNGITPLIMTHIFGLTVSLYLPQRDIEGLICTPLITETYKRCKLYLPFLGTNNRMTVLC